MKKFCFVIVFCSFHATSFAQEITEENYNKLDTELWKQYETDVNKIFECIKKYPEKKDSLKNAYNIITNLVYKKNHY